MIRKQLTENGHVFFENFNYFPFFFDFVDKHKKHAILVEQDDFYLEGTNRLILTGFHKVQERQYSLAGWTVTKISIHTILNSKSLELFSSSKNR